LNYLVPVQIGAPDMAKKENQRQYLSEEIKEEYNSIVKLKNNIKNRDLDGSYLAGLIEGDGYISITKEDRVILGITFNNKDIILANFILNKIGQGTIVKRKTNSVELRFSARKSIEYLVTLINGKFRTPKIDQLNRLID
jgi:hypothetical protein